MQMFRMQRSVNSVGGPSFHEKVGQRCKTDRACQSDRAVSLNNPCPRQTTLNSPHHHSHSPVCSPLVSPSGSFLDSLAVSCCPLCLYARKASPPPTNKHAQSKTNTPNRKQQGNRPTISQPHCSRTAIRFGVAILRYNTHCAQETLSLVASHHRHAGPTPSCPPSKFF